MSNVSYKAIIELWKTTTKLKGVLRTLPVTHQRRESDADHSWHLCLMVLTLAPAHLDGRRLLELAVVHDLAEIYAGDPWAFGDSPDKAQKEHEALTRILADAPQKVADKIRALCEEYEQVSSEEARFIKALDKLEPIVQNLATQGESWKRDKVDEQMIRTYKQPHMTPELEGLFEELLCEAKIYLEKR